MQIKSAKIVQQIEVNVHTCLRSAVREGTGEGETFQPDLDQDGLLKQIQRRHTGQAAAGEGECCPTFGKWDNSNGEVWGLGRRVATFL
jgi:hypothetical protein